MAARSVPRRGPARWMLLPYLTGTALLVGGPALLTLALAFCIYVPGQALVWVGWQNFAELWPYLPFQAAARNSLLFVGLAVPLRVGAALALALLLHRRPGAGLYRGALLLPTFIPEVAYALLWLWVLNPIYGPLNGLLAGLGLPGPAWLADGRTALLSLVLMASFQLGEGMVLLLAGRAQIPADLYAAAAVDGGGPWAAFRLITLPLLAPWLLLLSARDLLVCLQGSFTPSYSLTGGGPHMATLMLPLLIYEEAFDRLQFGRAAAIVCVLLAGCGLLVALAFWTIQGWGHDDAL